MRMAPRLGRILLHDRLSEPIHLNLVSLFVAAFGSFRGKVDFDLTIRRQYAYSILRAADLAKARGMARVTVAECGVASGAGLLAMCSLAQRTTETTGVKVEVVGFDGGSGLPPAQDYRDHPDLYQFGDYPMDHEQLRRALPGNGALILGPLAETAPRFIAQLDPAAPLGFVSIDVDYYSSTRDCLRLFEHPDARKYLPVTIVYLDDIGNESHNSWCGELLAVREFNEHHVMRKIEQDRMLRNRRTFKNAGWIDHIFNLHVLDHPVMERTAQAHAAVEVGNPYLAIKPGQVSILWRLLAGLK